MKSFVSYIDLFSHIYITSEVYELPSVRKALNRLPGIPVKIVKSKENLPPEYLNSKTLFVTSHTGETVGRCPGSRGHICCNYLTVDLYLGCPIGCSYCIMKSYLNFAPLTVYADTGPSIKRIQAIAEHNRDRIIRIGTGEVGDSLLLDPLFELTASFITGFSMYKNLYFEAKTKTANIDHLLDIQNKGNAVIGFSVNPREIVEAEEGTSDSLDDRLNAAEKAVKAGYNVSFHFDPIFFSADWENRYFSVVDAFKRFPEDKISWISLGTFRYPPELRDKIGGRPYLFGEFFPGKDRKYRYLQKIRVEVYKRMLEKIKSVCRTPVYLCMESGVVWEKVFGRLPGKIPGYEGIFKPPRLY
ncbi:MAG: radical SAM protein [Spirochaetota bacterium]